METKICQRHPGGPVELPRTEFYGTDGKKQGHCKECQKRIANERRLERFGSMRGYWLWRRYRITEADYDAMVDEQGGVCAICGSDDPQCVDHDHGTGKVRGVLCQGCNGALGYVENQRWLDSASQYLTDRG